MILALIVGVVVVMTVVVVVMIAVPENDDLCNAGVLSYVLITWRIVSVLIHFSIPLVIATSIPKVLLPVPVHPLIRTSCWAGKPFFALLIIVLNESISIMINNNSSDSNDIIVIKKIVITTTTTTTIDTVTTTTTNRPNYQYLSMHSMPLFWVLTPQHIINNWSILSPLSLIKIISSRGALGYRQRRGFLSLHIYNNITISNQQ